MGNFTGSEYGWDGGEGGGVCWVVGEVTLTGAEGGGGKFTGKVGGGGKFTGEIGGGGRLGEGDETLDEGGDVGGWGLFEDGIEGGGGKFTGFVMGGGGGKFKGGGGGGGGKLEGGGGGGNEPKFMVGGGGGNVFFWVPNCFSSIALALLKF